MAQKDEEKKPYTYTPFDPNSSTAYTTANGNATSGYDAWNTHNNNGFTFSQQDDLTDTEGLYGNWLNTKFNYDFNADALYQQYKDKYIKQGKMAMQDTMGQAAALTGGYGNSYASTVGNQAYQASLDNLNDVIPELYQMAYSMHQDKGQNLLNKLNLLNTNKAFEYGQWVDKGNTLYNNANYWQTEANNIYDRESTAHNTNESMLYQAAQDAIEQERWEAEHELNERQVALDEDKFHYTTGEYQSTQNPTQNPVQPSKDPDPAPALKPYTKEYYAKWSRADWYDYFEAIRLKEGKLGAEMEFAKLSKLGCIPDGVMASVISAVRSGLSGH